MQSPLFFAISCISLAISSAIIASRSLQNFEADLFGDAPLDPFLIDNDPSFEQMSPLDQITDLDSNMFDDNYGRYPMTGLDTNMFISDDVNPSQVTDSSFLLADDNFCDLGDADETDLFRNVRRETSCRNPPVSQAKPPERPKKNTQSSNPQSFYKDPMVLDISEAMCPPGIFRTSTLPVCLTAFDGRSIPVPGQDWFDLQDVFRTSASF